MNPAFDDIRYKEASIGHKQQQRKSTYVKLNACSVRASNDETESLLHSDLQLLKC